MTAREMLAELGLDLETPPEPTGGTLAADEPRQPTTPPSPTALDLDDWGRRKGAEALEGDVLGPILRDRESAEHAAADFYAAAFEPRPKLADRCTDDTRHRYLSELMATEEYQALHADTQLDPLAAELAAGHFAQGWCKLADEEAREKPEGNDSRKPGGFQGGAGGAEKGSKPDELRESMKALSAAATALERASDDVDTLRDAQRALGMGGDGAAPGQSVDPATLKTRFHAIRSNLQLRRIMELAGRYRRLSQARQRQKTTHGRDDVVGVELGDDLSRLCPSELAALADDDLQWDALRRLLERGLLQRDYRGVEPHGQGPIVVIVDESGSMGGEPIATAKALALAMGWIARHQRRWLCLVGFSGCCRPNVVTIAPQQWEAKQVELLDWLSHFYGGGSDRDVPTKELPEIWASLGCPQGKTDIIQVTDAQCWLGDHEAATFNAWKAAERARYLCLVIGGEDAGGLRAVADQVWTIPDLDLEENAIQEVMAI